MERSPLLPMDDSRSLQPRHGWILYDRDCGICRDWVRKTRPILARRGFGFAALQTDWVAARLAVSQEELLRGMRVITSSGTVIGGGDSMIYLSRFVWWWWPFYALSLLPGARPVIRAAYRWFAGHRSSFGRACGTNPK